MWLGWMLCLCGAAMQVQSHCASVYASEGEREEDRQEKERVYTQAYHGLHTTAMHKLGGKCSILPNIMKSKGIVSTTSTLVCGWIEKRNERQREGGRVRANQLGSYVL